MDRLHDLLRLQELQFRAGPTADSPATSVSPGHVTILVGPNNSGKSMALREIYDWSSQSSSPPRPWTGGKVVERVSAAMPESSESLEAFLRTLEVSSSISIPGTIPIPSFDLENYDPVVPGSGVSHVKFALGQSPDEDTVRQEVIRHFAVHLDGRRRFALAEPRSVSTLDQAPKNHLMAIWRNPDIYARVHAMVLEGIAKHVVINVADLPQLSLSLSTEAPPIDWQQSVSREVVAYCRKSIPLLEYSDGVQVYVGLISALNSLPHTLVLVDEPEAHLHPVLARQLGGQLTRIAQQRNANVVVATHSSQFVIGCVEQSTDVRILRLSYDGVVGTARALDAQQVVAVTRDPLLRSAAALEALFAYGAVVCEADGDRAFYAEINRRLIESPQRDGAPDTTFLNAQNWQTIPAIAAPLRRLGIPTAMILDLDTVTRTESWGRIFAAFGATCAETDGLSDERYQAGALLADAGRVGGPGTPLRCKVFGLRALDRDSRAVVERFLERLHRYGVFVVPVGELERWLPDLGVTNKQAWVTDMFRRLGTPGSPAYVAAGSGDVWDFLRAVGSWIRDGHRWGVPAVRDPASSD